VFLNLVVNAFEAMGEEGVLTIAARAREPFQASPEEFPVSAVAVAVEDTGPGVEPGRESELFRPFFTTKKGGVGLGLALAQKIVVSHNGTIEIESGAKGARFTVVLPWEGAVRRSAPRGSPGEESRTAVPVGGVERNR
jgi:nitrogen-specific signal transduction histidine kinase